MKTLAVVIISLKLYLPSIFGTINMKKKNWRKLKLKAIAAGIKPADDCSNVFMVTSSHLMATSESMNYAVSLAESL